MTEPVRLETERLLLRPFTEADAPLQARYSREPEARAQLADEVCETEDDARQLIAFLADCWRKRTYPLVLAVTRKSDGLLVGHASLSPIEEGVEIGYAIAQDFQRQGYAAEAAVAMTRWGLEALGLERVYGVVRDGNPASARVLTRAGYRRTFHGEADAFGTRCVIGRYECTLADLEEIALKK